MSILVTHTLLVSRAICLAAHVVGENTSGVLRTLRVLCQNVGSANQIAELLISHDVKM